MRLEVNMRKPPVVADWLISRMSVYNDRHSIRGDINELFNEMQNEKGYLRAVLWYWLQTVMTISVYFRFKVYWSFVMASNYLVITFRNLLKYKTFSVINITGLALSIAVCLMIIIYIKDWKSSDQFHEKKDRIVQVYTTDATFGWDVDGWATTPGTMASHLRENYSFVEDAVQMSRMWGNVINSGTAVFLSGLYVEPAFFNMFSFPLKEGDPATALEQPFSIVLSEDAAIKFFGDADPMNKTLSIEKQGEYTVTGILKNIEAKSHLHFEALASFSTVLSLEKSEVFTSDVNKWDSFTRYYTYALLNSESDFNLFERQVGDISASLIPPEKQERHTFALQRLNDINLGKNLGNMMPGVKTTIDVFYIPFLAMIIVFLACFNYIILSIARALKRTREIGLRKVVGAERGQILRLFLSETVVITLLALITACLILLWLIPVFNSLDVIENTKQQINFELMKDPSLYGSFILFALLVSVIAGLYPALYLSKIKTVNALKGKTGTKGFSRMRSRKILMSVQFGISIIVIIFIANFFHVYSYWTQYDRGIRIENMVSVSLREVDYDLFKAEILTGSDVQAVSASSLLPLYGGLSYNRIKTAEMEENQRVFAMYTDPGFVDSYDLRIIAGRNFSDNFPTDRETGAIINRKALAILNITDPDDAIGLKIELQDSTYAEIIGVLEDFTNRAYFESPIDPLLLRYNPERFRYINIAYTAGRKEQVREFITGTWQKFDKIHTPYFNFYDELQRDVDTSISGVLFIAYWICGFIIVISLFGLLGMTTYTTELRVKEIGIRKAMGAGVVNSVFVLSRDFLKLILISAAFAVPVGWFGSEAFIQVFAIRPELKLWVAPVSLLFILVLAVLTISSQTVKAAIANPVDTLREE